MTLLLNWSLPTLALAEPIHMDAEALANLQAMLPTEQPGLLPLGATIRRLSVRDEDVVVTLARPTGEDLRMHLSPHHGPQPPGELQRADVVAEQPADPQAEILRQGVIALVRERQGGLHFTATAADQPHVIQHDSPADTAHSSRPERQPDVPWPALPAPTQQTSDFRQYLLWITLPVAALLAWVVRRKKGRR